MPNTTFDNINWSAATYEGAKAVAFSFFAPSGSQTAVRLAKIGKTKIGKLTASFVANLTSDVAKNITAGKYNDSEGNFDSDLLTADYENLVYGAGITTLIEAGLGDKAQEMVDKLTKSSKTYGAKYQKLLNKMKNGDSAKRANKYKKKVAKVEKEMASDAKNVVKAKSKDAVVKKVGNEAQKTVRDEED